jgi:hypothetical protein
LAVLGIEFKASCLLHRCSIMSHALSPQFQVTHSMIVWAQTTQATSLSESQSFYLFRDGGNKLRYSQRLRWTDKGSRQVGTGVVSTCPLKQGSCYLALVKGHHGEHGPSVAMLVFFLEKQDM